MVYNLVLCTFGFYVIVVTAVVVGYCQVEVLGSCSEGFPVFYGFIVLQLFCTIVFAVIVQDE